MEQPPAETSGSPEDLLKQREQERLTQEMLAGRLGLDVIKALPNGTTMPSFAAFPELAAWAEHPITVQLLARVRAQAHFRRLQIEAKRCKCGHGSACPTNAGLSGLISMLDGEVRAFEAVAGVLDPEGPEAKAEKSRR